MGKNTVKVVRLKKGAEDIILENKKLTIYTRWIQDYGGAEAGGEVIIETYDRKTIGIGIYDGIKPIGARILSITEIAPISEIIERNIMRAYDYRKALGWKSYRLINSDGDLMPGLIINIYNDIAVI